MKRWDIINAFIKKYNYKSYLEVGTQDGNCFKEIICEHKVCIDIKKSYEKLTYEMSSDDYFKKFNDKFDIIFVDGLHTEEQTIKDIAGSLVILNENGTIIVHDCLPDTAEATAQHFCGTSYMAPIWYRMKITNVTVQVVDTDTGCAIIRRGKNNVYEEVTYEQARQYDYFASHKKELVNVLTVEEFKSLINS
jgi:Methyltransferase domain